MRDTSRPSCSAALSAGGANLRCLHLQPGAQCNAVPGSCRYQIDPVHQPAASGLQVIQLPIRR